MDSIDGFEFLDYQTVLARLAGGRAHLLLGNGFSIGCDPVFSYTSLYEAAVAAGLSERAQAVFQKLGTNNFEGVMRLLDDAHWVARTYGLIATDESQMLSDVEIVKRTLVEAIANSHLEHAAEVADDRKASALRFLEPYHNIFCTNYDLVLYWVNMSSDPPPYGDGFREDPDDRESPTLVFTERLGGSKGLFYVHGALHLFAERGQVRKHSWIRSERHLTQLVREGLAEGRYPLFVAEGSAEKKLEQIQRNGYLSYCLGKLGRVTNRLVVFGYSLGATDQHIANVISDNTDFKEVYIGLHGDPDSPSSRATRAAGDAILARRRALNERARRPHPLEVHYYDSRTARVWD